MQTAEQLFQRWLEVHGKGTQAAYDELTEIEQRMYDDHGYTVGTDNETRRWKLVPVLKTQEQ